MVIDILSIPPESADVESAFSSGRRTLSWNRERMSCENLEKAECISNWAQEGHITLVNNDNMGIVVEKNIRDMEISSDREFD